MKKVLVTGGAGFIGSNLTERLLNDNYKVVCIDNFDSFYDRTIKEKNIEKFRNNKNWKIYEGDILNKELLQKIFREEKIELVVHLAAKAGVRPSLINPIGYYETNVFGTINILEAMRNFGLKDMLFASSSSVYGNNKKLPFSETDNVDNPISPYAASKKAGELLCYTYHSLYDFNIFCYRFFTVYGPKQRPEMAIAKFANNILKGETITLFDGNGSTSRDYTYIDDIVNGLINSITRLKGYEIFNLGESQVVKLSDLVSLLEKYLGKKAKVEFGSRQAGDVERTFADVEKSRKMLEYNPKIKIEEGIELYCKWLLSE